MDNLEIYLYLILGIIYIISRVLKAKSKQQQTLNRPPEQPAQPHWESDDETATIPKKTVTLDDILREFEKNLKGEPYEPEYEEPAIEPAPKPNSFDSYKVPQEYKTYEGETYQDTSYNWSAYETTSIDDISHNKLSYEEPKAGYDFGVSASFTRDDHYTLQKIETNKYSDMLNEQQGLQDAVVLSEILNRKYF